MRRILAASNRESLVRLAESNAVVALDFDGTLCPISSDRDGVTMRPSTRRLLSRTCELYTTAVISGRGLADLTRRLGGVGVHRLIGNHGMEPHPGMEAFAGVIARAAPELAGLLRGQDGIEIENKRFSLSIHYRGARRPNRALDAILRAGGEVTADVRFVPGNRVVNVVPEGAPNKGSALRSFREELAPECTLFVGDDTTDEDAFSSDGPGALLSVRVGHSHASAASFYIRDQPEIDALLHRLVALRSPAFAAEFSP